MRPASLPTLVVYGIRRTVSECARCERVRPLFERGLCNSCRAVCRRKGTSAEFGYLKPDRMTDYAYRRRNGDCIALAAERIGVSKRTAERYEAQLVASGQAPWRGWPRAA